MSDPVIKQRPQFRNVDLPQLMNYRLPLPAKASILHRISGALLFLSLPLVLLPLFERSLASPETFASIHAWVSHPFCKLVLLALIWGYLHHFCAGIRYLIIDLHIGTDKESARKSAGVVFAVSLVLTVILGLKLFGVW